MSVRLESTGGIVHQEGASGITMCGVLYGDAGSVVDTIGVFKLVEASKVSDEIDCMACIAALPCDTVTFSGTIRLPPITVVKITLVIK